MRVAQFGLGVLVGHALRLAVTAALITSTAALSREPEGVGEALERLTSEGRFSGAVVIRSGDRTRFARGFGLADPFTGRPFTPNTPVDSASGAKPMTAAVVLILAREGSVDLDSPVQRYVVEYPHPRTTVRHLLSHSAGLAMKESPESLSGKTNSALIAEAGEDSPQPAFLPGSAFDYCNLCTVSLAILIERVTGRHYLDVLRDKVRLPRDVTLRPQRLADWTGRAIGYRRGPDGGLEPFDSWEGEAFYGPGNLSISASQLAQWGAEWLQTPLASLREDATASAIIAGNRSGLTIGNWYCASGGRRCHYGGHHEGFHHLYFWDLDRRISVAMLTNNTLAPALQQRLQRSLVAFAEGRAADAQRELAAPLADVPVASGTYVLPTGESVIVSTSGKQMAVSRASIAYPAYLIGQGIRYVPGLDLYVSGAPGGGLHWLTLYEDFVAQPQHGGENALNEGER